MPLASTLATLAADVLARLLDATTARARLEERIAIREARARADEFARKKFGL